MMSGSYDRLFKLASEADPRGLLHVAGIVGIDDDAVVLPIERELVPSALEIDHAFRIESQAGVRLALTEAQTYWKTDVPERLLDYALALRSRYRLPVEVVLIMLAEKFAPRTIPTEFRETSGSLDLVVRYRVVRTWEIDGRSVLKMGRPEIAPLVALMAGDESMVVDAGMQFHRHGGPVTDVMTLAGLRYDEDALGRILGRVRMIISEEILRQSSFFKLVRRELEPEVRAEVANEVRAEARAEILKEFVALRFPALSPMIDITLCKDAESTKTLLAELMRTADENRARDLIRRFVESPGPQPNL